MRRARGHRLRASGAGGSAVLRAPTRQLKGGRAGRSVAGAGWGGGDGSAVSPRRTARRERSGRADGEDPGVRRARLSLRGELAAGRLAGAAGREEKEETGGLSAVRRAGEACPPNQEP